jgi:hypothetical protein
MINIYNLYIDYDNNNEDIKNIIRNILNKNDFKSIENIKNDEIKNIINNIIPTDYYIYNNNCLINYIENEFIKNIFGDIYIYYDNIYNILLILTDLILEEQECNNKLVIIQNIDDITVLINNLQNNLENKELIDKYGHKNTLEYLNLLKNYLNNCNDNYKRELSEEQKNIFEIFERNIQSLVTDNPKKICIAIMLHMYNTLNNTNINNINDINKQNNNTKNKKKFKMNGAILLAFMVIIFFTILFIVYIYDIIKKRRNKLKIKKKK